MTSLAILCTKLQHMSQQIKIYASRSAQVSSISIQLSHLTRHRQQFFNKDEKEFEAVFVLKTPYTINV